MNKDKITYKDSGVDLSTADEIVKKIQPLAERVRRSEVISDIGPFSGMFDLKNYKNPVLVSSSDGVGSKLRIAYMVNKHDTIGIDLVAMCVNDIITNGAEPLFLLDYIATGKLNTEKITEIVKGIIAGCQIAGCSLIGGDTSEMPGLFSDDAYDLAGFVVGVVEKDDIIRPKFVESGDVIIGLSSSGLHSNGFSLCRKVLFDDCKLSPFSHINCLHHPLFEELLKPTKIYVDQVLKTKKEFNIKSIANITGGGFMKNIPRSIPKEFQANIINYSWEIPQIFTVIQSMSKLDKKEMFEVFNMGIGMTFIVKEKESVEIVKKLNDTGCESFIIGNISRKKRNQSIVFVDK